MRELFLAIMAIAVFAPAVLIAQSTPESVQVFLKPVDENGQALRSRDHSTFDAATTIQDVTLAVKLNDVNDVQKLHIKFGTTVGGNDKAELAVNFDGSNLPTGVTLTKKGNIAYVQVGSFLGLANYYAEVKVEGTGATMSPAAENTNIQ